MMILSVLEKRFDEAKFDGWQGYALLDLPHGEDPREDIFKRLRETLGLIPAPLREKAEQFLTINSEWFDEVMKNLCEEVAWDFFPESAACFLTALVTELEASSPESTWRRRQSEDEQDDISFGEPIQPQTPKTHAGSRDLP
jgi:hypothetical protein